MSGDQPKIIIDSDWKSQAQAEKERLSQKSEAAAAKSGKPGPDEPVTFEEIVRMFVMQALTFLGEVPDPRTGQRVLAPEYSRYYIDMLGVLEEKTKGNLTPEETQMLSEVVRDLRLSYAEVTKALAQAVKEGKIKPSASGGMTIGAPPGAVMGGATAATTPVARPGPGTGPLGGIKLS